MKYTIVTILLAGILVACTSPIREFTVQPELICAECTDINVSWVVESDGDAPSGTATLTAAPPPASPLAAITEAAGHQRVNVCETTTFTLRLSSPGHDDTTAQASVEVQPPMGDIRTLTLTPVCDRGVFRGWTSSGMPGAFSELVRIRWVLSHGDRNITLTHDSQTSPLSPAETSYAWDGLSAQGGWSATGTLNPLAGEGCPRVGTTGPAPGPEPSLPPPITLSVQMGCTP